MTWYGRALAGSDGQMGWDDYAKLASLVGTTATGQWYAAAPIAASYAGRASGSKELEMAGNVGSMASGIGSLGAGASGAASAAEVGGALASGSEAAGAAASTAQGAELGTKLSDIMQSYGAAGEGAAAAGGGAAAAGGATPYTGIDMLGNNAGIGPTVEAADALQAAGNANTVGAAGGTAAKTADAVKEGSNAGALEGLSNEKGDLDLDKVMEWWKGDSASRQGVDKAVDFISEYQKAQQQKVDAQARSFSATQRGRGFATRGSTVADAIRGR